MRFMERLGQQQKEFAKSPRAKATLNPMYGQTVCSGKAGSAYLEHFSGFVRIGKKFVLVVITHPRILYEEQIEHKAKLHAGPYPEDRRLMGDWTHRQSLAMEEFFQLGIDFSVKPDIRRCRFKRYTYLNLVAPIAYDPETFDESLKQLVKGLLSGEIILSEYFSGYEYNQKSYLEDLAEEVVMP